MLSTVVSGTCQWPHVVNTHSASVVPQCTLTNQHQPINYMGVKFVFLCKTYHCILVISYHDCNTIVRPNLGMNFAWWCLV